MAPAAAAAFFCHMKRSSCKGTGTPKEFRDPGGRNIIIDIYIYIYIYICIYDAPVVAIDVVRRQSSVPWLTSPNIPALYGVEFSQSERER